MKGIALNCYHKACTCCPALPICKYITSILVYLNASTFQSLLPYQPKKGITRTDAATVSTFSACVCIVWVFYFLFPSSPDQFHVLPLCPVGVFPDCYRWLCSCHFQITSVIQYLYVPWRVHGNNVEGFLVIPLSLVFSFLFLFPPMFLCPLTAYSLSVKSLEVSSKICTYTESFSKAMSLQLEPKN